MRNLFEVSPDSIPNSNWHWEPIYLVGCRQPRANEIVSSLISRCGPYVTDIAVHTITTDINDPLALVYLKYNQSQYNVQWEHYHSQRGNQVHHLNVINVGESQRKYISLQLAYEAKIYVRYTTEIEIIASAVVCWYLIPMSHNNNLDVSVVYSDPETRYVLIDNDASLERLHLRSEFNYDYISPETAMLYVYFADYFRNRYNQSHGRSIIIPLKPIKEP